MDTTVGRHPANRLIPALVLIAVLIPAVSAAGITFSTEQKDYYFLVNETATFPVTVTSTYPDEVSGMLETATTELLSKPDMMMTRSISKGYLRNVTPGTSPIQISAGASAYAETISVDLNFDYFDKVPMQVKMPRVVVHFVTDMSQAGSTGSSVSASSAPGGNGVGSPTSSSIILIQQPIPSAVQQSSLDPSGSSSSSSSGTQVGQVSQGNQNASALQQQLQQAGANSEENRTRFLAHLEADPLVQEMNTSLTGAGFSRTNLEVNPVSGDTGSFSVTYTGPQGEAAQVAGEMKWGSVQGLTETADAALPTPSAIGVNPTFVSFSYQVTGNGYHQVSTQVHMTPQETSLSAGYQGAGGQSAFVNATQSDGTVTRVTLEYGNPAVSGSTILLAAGILVVLAGGGYLVYRKIRASRTTLPEVVTGGVSPATLQEIPSSESGIDPEEALFAAELAFSENRYTEAYGLIGQGLRRYISRRWGDGSELTGDEARAILHERRTHLQWADEMLGKCSLIEFAKGSPDPAEFRKFAETLREFYGKKG